MVTVTGGSGSTGSSMVVKPTTADQAVSEVALMPFTNDLAGDFSGKTTAEVLFSGNMMVLGLLFLANWVYATGGSRLVDPDLDSALIRRGLRRNMVTPAVSVVVIVLSYFIPHWSLWFYLLVPAILWLKPFRR